jgi:hypothetical protein
VIGHEHDTVNIDVATMIGAKVYTFSPFNAIQVSSDNPNRAVLYTHVGGSTLCSLRQGNEGSC